MTEEEKMVWDIALNQEPPAHRLLPLGYYRHFKGDIYKVLHNAYHTEEKKNIVVYERFLPRHSIPYARDAANFTEQVTVNGKTVRRFEFIGTNPNIRECCTAFQREVEDMVKS